MGTFIDRNPTLDPVQRQLDREVELVRGAIRMVASGASSATTIAGIRFGEQAINLSRLQASAAGVSLASIWRIDDSGCDVRVTPASHA
jgi:hypothetical protein